MSNSQQPKLVVKLVSPEDLQRESEKGSRRTNWIVWLLAGMFIMGVGAGLGSSIFPKLPSSLSPEEAARILKTQKGFAGYSLISNEGDNSTLGHAIFCQNCGTEVAVMRVEFVKQAEPQPGSRLALMMDLAKRATASTAKPNEPTEATPVVARR